LVARLEREKFPSGAKKSTSRAAQWRRNDDIRLDSGPGHVGTSFAPLHQRASLDITSIELDASHRTQ
jgi:hypothetical protein